MGFPFFPIPPIPVPPLPTNPESFLNPLLKMVGLPLLNLKINRYGTVTDLFLKNKALHLSVVLQGLEEHPIEVACTKFRIAQDGSALIPEAFSSNMPFLENLLNDFGKRPLEIPDGKLRWGLSKFAKLFS